MRPRAPRHRVSYSDQMEYRRVFASRFRVVLTLFLAYAFVSVAFLRSYGVESRSMAPTVERGDVVLATPLLYGPKFELFGFRLPAFAKPKHGDIVVMDAPFRVARPWYWRIADSVVRFVTFQRLGLPDGTNTADRAVKRVIGVPGDRLYQKDFVYYVKPAGQAHFLTEFELTGNAYDIDTGGNPEGWPAAFPLSGEHGEILLGIDEYFVAGDRRSGASDSRLYGPVSSQAILSRVVLRTWPLGRLGPVR